MARPKHDYDGDDFYDSILMLAMQGALDSEIADSLDLSPEVFCCMKGGKYDGWDEEENARRSERIYKVLARGRRKTNSVVRGRYLKAALGGIKTKSSTKRYVQDRCECGGGDKACPMCGGTGWITLTDKSVVQETETELPPNMQALATWLYHHDEEWRIYSQSRVDVTTNGKDLSRIVFSPTPLTERDIQEIKDIQDGKTDSDNPGVPET